MDLQPAADLWHVCLIFDDEEQRREVVLDYLASALRRGEQVRYLADTQTPEAVLAWLKERGGPDFPAAENDALGVLDAQSFYCRNGCFDPREPVGMIPAAAEQAVAHGFRGIRITSEMSWALRDIPGTDRVLEYEAMLGTMRIDFPRAGMCQYDSRRFDGALLYKILQLHPAMIAAGQIVRNPFYVRPEEFLTGTSY